MLRRTRAVRPRYLLLRREDTLPTTNLGQGRGGEKAFLPQQIIGSLRQPLPNFRHPRDPTKFPRRHLQTTCHICLFGRALVLALPLGARGLKRPELRTYLDPPSTNRHILLSRPVLQFLPTSHSPLAAPVSILPERLRRQCHNQCHLALFLLSGRIIIITPVTG